MTKTEIAAIANDSTGIYTADQKAKAQAALDANTPAPDADGTSVMLVALRKKLLKRLLREDTPESKQTVADLKHNWPDYETTGKVLGE
jgi:hypothetical protein